MASFCQKRPTKVKRLTKQCTKESVKLKMLICILVIVVMVSVGLILLYMMFRDGSRKCVALELFAMRAMG